MTLDEYRDAVSRLLERDYALTWQDAGGGDEPLARALAANESPAEFVEWFAGKYGLESTRDVWR